MDRSPAERAVLLEERCGGDPTLIVEVRCLLEAHDASGEDLRKTASSPLHSAMRRIGPYLVERELGAGGMGAVYLASRADQYEKRVAIKLVQHGAG